MILNGRHFDVTIQELGDGWRHASRGMPKWSSARLHEYLDGLPVFRRHGGMLCGTADLICRLQAHWRRHYLARRVEGKGPQSRWAWVSEEDRRRSAAEQSVREWFDLVDQGLYDLADRGAELARLGESLGRHGLGGSRRSKGIS